MDIREAIQCICDGHPARAIVYCIDEADKVATETAPNPFDTWVYSAMVVNAMKAISEYDEGLIPRPSLRYLNEQNRALRTQANKDFLGIFTSIGDKSASFRLLYKQISKKPIKAQDREPLDRLIEGLKTSLNKIKMLGVINQRTGKQLSNYQVGTVKEALVSIGGFRKWGLPHQLRKRVVSVFKRFKDDDEVLAALSSNKDADVKELMREIDPPKLKLAKGKKVKPGEETPETHPQLFTDRGERLDKPIGDTPKVNPAYAIYRQNPEEYKAQTGAKKAPYYATSRNPSSGKKQYHYVKSDQIANDQMKFATCQEFAQVYPQVRKQMALDLQTKFPRTYKHPRTGKEIKFAAPKVRVMALCGILIDATLIRVGNPQSADVAETYGASTLQVRHVTFQGDQIILNFKGKESVPNKASFTPSPQVMAEFQKLVEGKGPNEPLFTYQREEGGKQFKVNRKDMEQYGTMIGLPEGKKFHVFRMHRATVEARLRLVQNPEVAVEEVSEDEWNDYVRQVATDIGENLNHWTRRKKAGKDTWVVNVSTTISQYIDPTVIEEAYKNAGYDVPKWVGG